MGQVVVRQIDDETKQRLQKRAARHGVSMEEEIRTILRNVVLRDEGEQKGLGTEIAELFADFDLKQDELEPLPWSEIKPATFE